MNVVRDMIEKAFTRGSVLREDYQIDTDNKEQLVFIGPDGTKRVLGCYPGSVRVSLLSFSTSKACLGDCGNVVGVYRLSNTDRRTLGIFSDPCRAREQVCDLQPF